MICRTWVPDNNEAITQNKIEVTWKPNIAWSQSRISSSIFFLWPFGHGKPLVLRSVETVDWICHEMSNQLTQARTQQLGKEKGGRGVISVQPSSGTNLRISHDSLILTIRIKRKNIVRYIYLCLFCYLSVSFQNLRKIEERHETFKNNKTTTLAHSNPIEGLQFDQMS